MVEKGESSDTHLSAAAEAVPTQSETKGKPYTVLDFLPQRLKSSTVRL